MFHLSEVKAKHCFARAQEEIYNFHAKIKQLLGAAHAHEKICDFLQGITEITLPYKTK